MYALIRDCRPVVSPDLSADETGSQSRSILNLNNNEIGLVPFPFVVKARCDADTRTAVVAATESVYEIPVHGEGLSRFHFAFALDDVYRQSPREPVEFEIQLQAENRVQTLFRQLLTMSRVQSFGWQDHSVPLDLKGRALIRLISRKKPEVKANSPIMAFWSALQIIPCTVVTKEDSPPPNLIVISLDTLRADHLRAFGYHRNTAPALDGLIEESTRFENCSSQWHSTQVSHNCILSGQYEQTHQVPDRYAVTPARMNTLAEILAANGYLTTAFTGGGWMAASLGLCKGFERYVDNETRKNGSFELADNYPQIENWLNTFAPSRFFLLIHTYQIHSPYPTYMKKYDSFFRRATAEDLIRMKLQPQSVKDSFDRLGFLSEEKQVSRDDTSLLQCMRDYYDASILCTNDYLLAPLFHLLKRKGLYDRTIIVVLSDHGEEFFEHERFYHNDSLYEELIHVPLIIKPSGKENPPQTVSTPVQTVDLLPTLLEMMKLKDPEPDSRDGRSLADTVLKGTVPPQRPVFSQSQAKFSVRLGSRKLILRTRVAPEEQTIIPRIEAFDLRKDPGEQKPQPDDISGFEALYSALFRRFIQKHPGVHIRIPPQFSSQKIDIEIHNPDGNQPVRRILGIGLTRQDHLNLREGNQSVFCSLQGSTWDKELIIVPAKEGLTLNIRIRLDGRTIPPVPSSGIVWEQGLFRMTEIPAKMSRLRPDGISVYAIMRPYSEGAARSKLSRETQKKISSLGYLE